MARKITIPITDHGTPGVCSVYYSVEYQLNGDTGWTETTTYEPPVVLNNLLDDAEYNIRITRQCCDGVRSTPLLLTVNTTILAAPAGFTATAGDVEVVLDWDDVTGAEAYVLERAEDAAFTVNLTEVYNDTTSGYTDTSVVNDTTYYYRVKATATYHADSEYSTDNATPTAS